VLGSQLIVVAGFAVLGLQLIVVAGFAVLGSQLIVVAGFNPECAAFVRMCWAGCSCVLFVVRGCGRTLRV
jgi:hypothetical protein